MKDKLLQIRVDEDFLSKLEYLQEINSYKSIAKTVRKIVEKEYMREKYSNRGKWVWTITEECFCSNCGIEADQGFIGGYMERRFCPHCGAYMGVKSDPTENRLKRIEAKQ